MFYSEKLLTKQGSPLAVVWLVGSLDKKLTRREVNSADILKSVRIIRDNEEGTLALRLEGQLLLGVSRIYNTKVRNLETDCNVAFTELKAAFKPGNVNLPGSSDLPSLLPEDGDEISIISRKRKQPNAPVENRNTLLQNTLTDFADLLPDLPMEITGELTSSQSNNIDGFSQFTQIDNFDQSIEIGRRRGLEEDDDEEEEDINLNLDLDLNLDQEIELGRNEEEQQPELILGNDYDDNELPPMIPDDDNNDIIPTLDDSLLNQSPATPPGDDVEFIKVIDEPQQLQSKSRRKGLLDQTTTIAIARGDTMSQSQTQDEGIESILTSHPVLPKNSIEYGLLSLSNNNSKLLDCIINPYNNPLLDLRLLSENFKQKIGRRTEDEDQDITLQQLNFPGQQQDDDYNIPLPLGGDDDDNEPNSKSLRLDEEGRRGEVSEQDYNNSPINSPLPDFEDEEDFFAGTSFFGPSTQTQQEEETPTSSSQTTSQPQSKGVSRNTILAANKLRRGLDSSDNITFSQLSEGTHKYDKVKMFFEVLVLATKDAISVNQSQPFEDFNISAKPRLYDSIWDQQELSL